MLFRCQHAFVCFVSQLFDPLLQLFVRLGASDLPCRFRRQRPNAPGLPGRIVTLAATSAANSRHVRMPPACPGGSLRSPLHRPPSRHVRLPPACPGGSLRSSLQPRPLDAPESYVARNVNLPRTSRGHPGIRLGTRPLSSEEREPPPGQAGGIVRQKAGMKTGASRPNSSRRNSPRSSARGSSLASENLQHPLELHQGPVPIPHCQQNVPQVLIARGQRGMVCIEVWEWGQSLNSE
jgi:hypothetical protein